MAYNISPLASSLSCETRVLCSFLHPSCLIQLKRQTALNFPVEFRYRKPLLIISQVSLQDQSLTVNDKTDFEVQEDKFISRSKPSVWVNPRNPKASRLRKKSNSFRYASLVKIAESLDSYDSVEKDVFNVLRTLGDNIVARDGAIILNYVSNTETALLVLKFFQEKLKISEVILYNVTLKGFRKCKDFNGAENLFGQMLQRGFQPDNITFSTLISCARHCNLPDKAVEWFEKMPSFGCEPDGITYSVMIDAYGRAGNVDTALSLYDRARSENWRIDAVTFSTLIKIYGASGNYDGCLNLYEEMKALTVKPNATVYNTLLDAMGKAKRPWQAKTFYREMLNKGIEPTWGTYAALIRAYSKVRYGKDAFAIYREMKGKGLELNVILCNTLLSTCADVGFTDEALEIFEDMKRSETCTPDNWTFASMITIYSCTGQVKEAEAALTEMLQAGFEPNIFVLTSLIQCYGKAGHIDDVVRTFDRLIELNIAPDERFCSCLLNVITQVPNEELGKLIDCIERANPKIGCVVKPLIKGDITGEIFKKFASELFDSIGADVKKAYCNCLIDLSVNLNQLERACELLDLGLTGGIYTDIMSKTPTQWSLHLKSLSTGAALTALHIWVNDLSKSLDNGEELPSLLGINTGHGKHKFSDKGLAGVFESHLKELNAPFHEVPDKAGWFLTTKVAVTSWLESRRSQEKVAA